MLEKLQALWRQNPVRISAIAASVIVFIAAKAGIVLDANSVSEALAVIVPILLAGELSRAQVVPLDKLVTDPAQLPDDEIDQAEVA